MRTLFWITAAGALLALAAPLPVTADKCAPNRDASNCEGDCPKEMPNCRILVLVDRGQGWKVTECVCHPDKGEIDLCYFQRLTKEEKDKDKEKKNVVGDYRCTGKCKDDKKKCTLVVLGDQGMQTATCKCKEPEKKE